MKRTNQSGFTLLEVMTAVAIMGFLVAMAVPSMLRMRDAQETKTTGTQMAGLLSDARARAVSEGTPHLVYFNAPTSDGSGNCGAVAVEVRDLDHSYSITPGDQTQEFNLPSSACNKVKPYDTTTAASGSTAAPPVPMPPEDLAVRAPDAAAVGAVASASSSGLGSVVSGVASTASGVAGGVSSLATGLTGGSSSSGPGSPASSGEDSSGKDSGSTTEVIRSATVAETAVNGATFPIDPNSGRAVVAFSEHGVPVDPANPTSWGSGAGGIYLTDTEGDTIVAALVQPLGDVKLRVFDPASQTWK